jgi:Ras-related protein Rab-7A
MLSKADRIVLKIVVLGASNVGKTSLMKRYCTDKFSGTRRATIGADFMTKRMKIGDIDFILQIWDTAGQERFHQGISPHKKRWKVTLVFQYFSAGTLGHSFYKEANGCMLVYDVTNEASLEQLISWRDEATTRVDSDSYFPIVVVGNKIDLKTESNSVDQLSILNWASILYCIELFYCV